MSRSSSSAPAISIAPDQRNSLHLGSPDLRGSIFRRGTRDNQSTTSVSLGATLVSSGDIRIKGGLPVVLNCAGSDERPGLALAVAREQFVDSETRPPGPE